MKVNLKYSVLILVVCSTHLTAKEFRLEECLAFSSNRYENAYCKIKSQGQGGSLPSFQDFKNSAPMTQWLLTKKYAKKIGLTLTKPAAIQAAKETRPKREYHLPEKTDNSVTQTSSDLNGCLLLKDTIQCNKTQYYLATNTKLKKRLRDITLKRFPQNREGIPLSRYLTESYKVYIENMLSLGLGDSSMSYTKFNAVYKETQKQGKALSVRFHKMFQLLIKERQTQSVLTRYNSNYPKSMAACMQLTSKVIVCDNIKQNWIYKKGA